VVFSGSRIYLLLLNPKTRYRAREVPPLDPTPNHRKFYNLFLRVPHSTGISEKNLEVFQFVSITVHNSNAARLPKYKYGIYCCANVVRGSQVEFFFFIF
jgi:hypothetical protein